MSTSLIIIDRYSPHTKAFAFCTLSVSEARLSLMEMQMELQPQPHVLLLPFPAQGHIKPMLALAQLLCHAGIHVTFLNTEHNHRQLTQRQALSTRFPTLHFHSISDGLPSDHPRSISPNLMDIVTSLRSKTAPLLHQLLVSLMSKNDVGSAAQLPPLGCVITDGIMCFAIEVAEEVGIPVIALRTTSACSFWCYSCIPKLIEEAQLPFGGNKNYLPDALTRELAMFSKRNDDDDEGRNPRSRRAGKEHETNEDPKEKILKKFLLSPRGLATTDQSQGKGLTSPSQTADGKGSSRPLTAVALPKSKPTPTGVINVFNYEFRTFDTPVFRTGRRLAYHQKTILDNLLFVFQERSSGLMFPALFALAEELYENARPQFEELQQSAVKKEKINFLESPESARVPIMALTEADWHKFHNLIGRHNSEDLVPPTLFIIAGPYVGRYLVNVQSEHPQEHKLWLVENGFVHNLWTKTNDDLKGLPPIIVNTVKNVRKTDCELRLKFRSTPPEWIQQANGEVEYIAPYHYVRIIPRQYLQPACVRYNGQPNSSIPWMKAMTLEYIKKIISEDLSNTFLAAGEKIIITAYDHPDVVSSDLFLSLTRKEIDSTMACMQWMDKLENDNHYKMYVDTDVEDNATIVRMAQTDNHSFVFGHHSETDDNM